MELWTILRCWCILYVLAVILQSFPMVDSHVPLTRSRTGRVSSKWPTGSFVTEDDGCEQLPAEELGEMLGGAYNARYMSIQAPKKRDLDPNSKKRGTNDEELLFAVDGNYAQELSDQPAWAVKFAAVESQRNKRSTEGEDYEDVPIEEDDMEDGTMDADQEEQGGYRELRSAVGGGSGKAGSEIKKPWDCGMQTVWKDLGEDYFPRFLRVVECAKTQCFYGRYTCQPRSFTVQLLRRRRGRCVRINGGGGGNSTTNSSTSAAPRKKQFVQYRTGEEGLNEKLRELWVWEERALNFCCDCASGNRRF